MCCCWCYTALGLTEYIQARVTQYNVNTKSCSKQLCNSASKLNQNTFTELIQGFRLRIEPTKKMKHKRNFPRTGHFSATKWCVSKSARFADILVNPYIYVLKLFHQLDNVYKTRNFLFVVIFFSDYGWEPSSSCFSSPWLQVSRLSQRRMPVVCTVHVKGQGSRVTSGVTWPQIMGVRIFHLNIGYII